MKDKILKLRSEGKSYMEIMKELGCSSSTVSYHCGEGQKEKTSNRQKKRFSIKRGDFKLRSFKKRNDKTRDFQRRNGTKMIPKSTQVVLLLKMW